MIEYVFVSGDNGLDLAPALVCDNCRKQVAGLGNVVWFVRSASARDILRREQASPLFVTHKGLCDEMLMGIARRHYPVSAGWTDQCAEAGYFLERLAEAYAKPFPADQGGYWTREPVMPRVQPGQEWAA